MFIKSFPLRLLVVLTIFALSSTLLVNRRAAATGSAAPLTVYSNPTSITINSSTATAPIPATVYPSTIDVSGMTGTVTRVAVTLKGLSHARLDDIDALLVSPTGAKYVFLADAGLNAGSVQDKFFTFADDAATTVPTFSDVPSGSYRPTSGDAVNDFFPPPAPAGPYNQPAASTFASTFNGAVANGTWSLYVVDDSGGGLAGNIHSGWSITITTDGSPSTFSNSSYMGIHDQVLASAPYGTGITVSGVSGVVSNLKLTLTGFSHARPQDVDVLLVNPNGKGVVVMSDVGGTSAVNNVNITFDDAAASTVFTPIVSGTYRPTDTLGASDFFPAPAPLPPYHSSTGSNQLSNFNGFSPNGEWKLFVVDSQVGSSGSISGGWSLDITTTPVTPPTPAGCGAPSFATSSFSTGTLPTNLAIADYNNDTKQDLAVTNQVSNNVSILLGIGNGTFASQMQFGVGSSPYSVAAGRFNADANVDLAVVNSGSNNVSILLGNGDGTFGAPTSVNVGPSPISVAAGDLNNDGNLDLAVANFGSFFSGSVSILLGNGSGGFSAGTTVRTRTQPSFVAIANLNQSDSNRDLVVTTFGSNSVSTFFGNGNGTFTLSQNLATGSGPVSVEVADVGIPDGAVDLVVSNYNGDTIATFPGSANGTFGSGSSTPVGPNPISVAVADYASSGITVPAIALGGTNVVRVGSTNTTVGANPNAIDAVDLNGDGKPDLVSVNSGSNDVTVMLNNCTVAAGNLFDWDGDRKTDFVVYRPSTQDWFNPSLSPTTRVKNLSQAGDQIVPADFDGDTKTDYAFYRPENGLWVVHNAAKPVYFLQFGLPQDIPSPADFDGDGKADIAVFRPSDGNWYIRRSTDNSVETIHFGGSGDKPVQADFDGDKKADVAVFRPSTGIWYVMRSSDSQVFILQFGTSEDKTVVGDYDGDGKADIAVWRPSTSVWWIRRSSDEGVFALTWGAPTDIPVVGDFDNDGKFDPATFRPSDRTWYVMKSSDGGAIYFVWGLSGDFPVPNAFVR